VSTKDAVDQAIANVTLEEARLFMQRVAEVFFWDSCQEKWDDDKEWDVDFLTDVRDHLPAKVLDAVSEASRGCASKAGG
jgi:hypothetical protein